MQLTADLSRILPVRTRRGEGRLLEVRVPGLGSAQGWNQQLTPLVRTQFRGGHAAALSHGGLEPTFTNAAICMNGSIRKFVVIYWQSSC